MRVGNQTWVAQPLLAVRICRSPHRFARQKLSFNANWITRGSPAEVMLPKLALPTVVFGAPSGGVLVRLNISVRKSRLKPSASLETSLGRWL